VRIAFASPKKILTKLYSVHPLFISFAQRILKNSIACTALTRKLPVIPDFSLAEGHRDLRYRYQAWCARKPHDLRPAAAIPLDEARFSRDALLPDGRTPSCPTIVEARAGGLFYSFFYSSNRFDGWALAGYKGEGMGESKLAEAGRSFSIPANAKKIIQNLRSAPNQRLSYRFLPRLGRPFQSFAVKGLRCLEVFLLQTSNDKHSSPVATTIF
jgi:hypothetical protein